MSYIGGTQSYHNLAVHLYTPIWGFTVLGWIKNLCGSGHGCICAAECRTSSSLPSQIPSVYIH